LQASGLTEDGIETLCASRGIAVAVAVAVACAIASFRHIHEASAVNADSSFTCNIRGGPSKAIVQVRSAKSLPVNQHGIVPQHGIASLATQKSR
jgi:hypothetical protein